MATLGAIKIPIKVVTKGVSASLGMVKKSLKALTSLPGLGAIFSGGYSVKKLLEVGDSYVNLNAKLTDLLGTAWQAEEAQENLYQMSQRTGTQVEANADAYTKLIIAQKMTGLNAYENIEVLEGLNKIFALSGANALDTSIAMRQLGQALASGKLQGDEFRSIAEAAPGLLLKLSEALGVPIGDLKKMGSEGKLTSEILGKAFLDIARSNDMAFKELPVTSARAFQRIINSAQRLWDNILDNTGLITFIATEFDEVALWIEQNQGRFTEWAMIAKDFIIASWKEIKIEGKILFDELAAYAEEWGPKIKQVFEDVISIIIKLLPYIKKVLDGLLAIATGSAAYTKEEMANVGAFDTQAKFRGSDAPEYSSGAPGGGTVINNNINQKMSRGDLAQLNTDQARQASRS